MENPKSKTNEEIKSLTRKIKALLAKTVEAGASEAEAMSAFTLAHKLLEQYQLNLSDLDLREEGTDHVKLAMDSIARRLSKRVGEYCECKVWMSDLQPTYVYRKVGKKEKKFQGPDEYTKVNYIGIKTDADFATWLLAALTSYVSGRETSYLFGEFCNSATDADDFTQGCIDRINARLREEVQKRNIMRAESTGRDLIPLKNAMITEKFASLGIRLTSVNHEQYRIRNGEAYTQGVSAGEGVTFHRPVEREYCGGVKLLGNGSN